MNFVNIFLLSRVLTTVSACMIDLRHSCKVKARLQDRGIGAYGPVAERIKVHCFFTKMIGTVPLFIGPVPFSCVV